MGKITTRWRFPRFRSAPPASDLAEMVALLAGARRPLVFAGGGVLLSDACAAVTQLAETTGIPVITSLNGKGTLDERHPLVGGEDELGGPVAVNDQVHDEEQHGDKQEQRQQS